ncbi:MAG: hypothetical protein QOI06_1268 [Nocardioidaceae bacterium]|jgi:uncharacterized membrane protein (TIGR02234 family)|nr:hypothetical protein [Nocardioidaceae bacterium]
MGAVTPRGDGARGSGRRLYGPALIVGLLGATGVTVGASRPWISATATTRGLPTIHASASGADLAPLAGALGVVLLAAFGAIVATRGWVRRCLGAAILVASVGVLVAVIDASGSAGILTSALSAKGWSGDGGYRTSTQVWRWLVVASALGTALAGAATAAYGDQWAVMGSRYDAPRAPGAGEAATTKSDEELSETDVWQAIDQGRDPTQAP